VLCHSPTAPAGVLANSGIAQTGAFSVDADASSSSSQTDSEIVMSQHQQELVLKLKVRFFQSLFQLAYRMILTHCMLCFLHFYLFLKFINILP
jgi:hypothetical protein